MVRGPRMAIPCRGRMTATQFGVTQPDVLLPKVGLEPTPFCEYRILSPARLPSVWYWADVGLTLISGVLLAGTPNCEGICVVVLEQLNSGGANVRRNVTT